jgi:hypothetical protein
MIKDVATIEIGISDTGQTVREGASGTGVGTTMIEGTTAGTTRNIRKERGSGTDRFLVPFETGGIR